MSLDEFLKEKQAHEEGKEDSRKREFHDKCIAILGKIKEKSEEKYSELSHIFHHRFNGPNIQRKVIMGFYAQLVAEMKALDPTPVITQTAKQIKKEVKNTVAATKKTAKALATKVEAAANQVKKATKTDKKATDKTEKKAPVKKATPKKTATVAKKRPAAATGKKKAATKGRKR